jgi:hypothetical protein
MSAMAIIVTAASLALFGVGVHDMQAWLQHRDYGRRFYGRRFYGRRFNGRHFYGRHFYG